MHLWLNGEFLDHADARISVFDAGFQHGVGLFETMLARGGKVLRLYEHLERLERSANELRLTERLHIEPLASAVALTLERNGLAEARIRITLTGGDLSLLQSRGERAQDPTILIVVQPPTPYPDAFFDTGVKVVFASARANPWVPTAGHKTLDYWPRLRMLQEAASRQAAEAIWLALTANVASGSVSNVFLVRDGALVTPLARTEAVSDDTPEPVLPGITRAAIIEMAIARGLDVERRAVTADELFEADEVFLTNASWGVLPVVRLEREVIGSGAVGPVTGDLRADWLA